MRRLTRKEAVGRGCRVCTEHIHAPREKYAEGESWVYVSDCCKYERCPFRELDAISDYDAYCDRLEKATGSTFERLISMLRTTR